VGSISRIGATVAAGFGLVACSLFADLGGFDTEAADDAATPGSDGGADGGATPNDGSGAGSDAGADGNADPDAAALDPYVAEVLKDAPVAWFRFEEKDGTDAKDEMGGPPAKYSTNGIELGAAGVRGSRAVRLDGSGSITLGKRFGFDGKLPHSIEVWFTAEIVDQNVRYIWSHRGFAQQDVDWYALYYNEGALLYERRTPTTNAYCGAPTPTTGVRYHAVLTFGATARLLVDGKLTEESFMIGDIGNPSDAELVVGDRTGGQLNKLKGTIDELAIYDKLLGDVRVKAHYDAATK
jgi:hypothetical protein